MCSKYTAKRTSKGMIGDKQVFTHDIMCDTLHGNKHKHCLHIVIF